MRKLSVVSLILLSLIVSLLCSCTVTQTFDFENGFIGLAGSSQTQVKTDNFFQMVMEDLSSWSGTTDDAVDNFEINLANSRKAYGIDFEHTSDNSWNGVFAFFDFEGLVKSLSNIENQDVISVSKNEDVTRVEFKIDMDNYSTLASMVPFLSDPNFEVYGPLYNNYMEEDDYLEMIAFILGEDGPESIKNSSITININTKSEIKATNAEKVNSNTLKFTFPLIDFLLLHEGISFWFEF